MYTSSTIIFHSISSWSWQNSSCLRLQLFSSRVSKGKISMREILRVKVHTNIEVVLEYRYVHTIIYIIKEHNICFGASWSKEQNCWWSVLASLSGCICYEVEESDGEHESTIFVCFCLFNTVFRKINAKLNVVWGFDPTGPLV